MSGQPPTTATALFRRGLLLPINILRYSAAQPAITGALLYALTRGSPELKEKLLGPFRSNLLATNGTYRLSKFIDLLKALFAIGIIKRVNSALNRLALNAWSLSKPGTPWKWDGKTELVVVTGGCSGFGYEMVKGFQGKARVVVLDVNELPKELASCKCMTPSS
jgi:all-trans-retinol dehydrogenase (NAD+)